jgi:hypothetical protein
MDEPNYHVEMWSGVPSRLVCDVCGWDSFDERKVQEHLHVGHGLEPVKGEMPEPTPAVAEEAAPGPEPQPETAPEG